MPDEISHNPSHRSERHDTQPGHKLLGLLSWCDRQPSIGIVLIALVLSAPVPLMMALAPDVVVNYTHHDMFIPLDAAWRTLQGQWPHTDVYSPLGLAYFWLHGAAAWLWGMDGRVVIRANLLALPFVLIPALTLAWHRLNALCTILLTVFLTVLVVAPTFLDGPVRLIAELANYNRIGAAACAVVCLWALCSPRGRAPWIGVAESVMLGVLMLVLLYLKVTFFLLAAVIVLVGCAIVRRFWRDAMIAAAVGLAGVITLEILHPGLLFAYVADIRRAGASNPQIFRPVFVVLTMSANLLSCIVIAVLAAALLAARGQGKAAAGFLVVTAGCLAVAMQNFGSFSAPLIVLVMLLAQRVAAGAGAIAPRLHPVVLAATVVAVLMTTLPIVLLQTQGTIYATVASRVKGKPLGTGASPLADVVWLPAMFDNEFVPNHFSMEEASTWQAATLPAVLGADILADGVALLETDGLAQRRIVNLQFDNPFPVMLKAPPARGTALWWDENRTYTAAKLTPEMVFGDADVVMVPKLWWVHSITSSLYDVARTKLEQEFVPHESHYWTAWVKRANS
jgi:hypothetical protein